MRIVKVDHLVLYVADVDESIRFYKVLGFQVQNAKERYELFAGDFRLHLYPQNRPASVAPAKLETGVSDICLELDSGIDLLRDYLASQGVSIAQELMPRSGARGAMRSFFVRDPDGNLVEIASYDS